MRRFNVFDAAVEGDPAHPPGYRAPRARFGSAIGAQKMGATVYELEPGNSICPYHYENTEEEWLLVLGGTPTLRTPEGENELAPGDVVAFVEGPDGAHKVTNNSEGPVRVLMLSTIPESDISICVYPDSDKVSVHPPGKIFRLSDAVGYWDGEL
ncbi:MAG: cupin domain-containing protein [Thermoleophilaceae bacterium]